MSDEQSSDEIIAEFTKSEATPVETVTTEEPKELVEPPKVEAPSKYKYKVDGKEIEEPLEMILKRASQGYNYSQRMAEINRKAEAYQKLDDDNKQLSKWREYDEYARTNPKWNEHVQKMWEEKSRYSSDQIDPENPFAKEFTNLRKEFDEYKNTQMEAQKKVEAYQTLEKQSKEDLQLDGEIKSLRSKYSYVDFDKADEFGNSLETQIVNHAVKNGMNRFTTAFLDYYHEPLLSIERERAKESLLKETQENKKKGIIGKTQLPLINGKDLSAKNVRARSYDDLAREAIEELGAN